MNDEKTATSASLPWWARWQTWLKGVLVCLAAYVLTAPFFVEMIVPDDSPSPEQIARLQAIYGPHDHSNLFETFYQWWKHVLGYN